MLTYDGEGGKGTYAPYNTLPLPSDNCNIIQRTTHDFNQWNNGTEEFYLMNKGTAISQIGCNYFSTG